MVQTEQQYICIHQCLLAVLEGKENIGQPPREIHDNQGYEGMLYNYPTPSNIFKLIICGKLSLSIRAVPIFQDNITLDRA